MSAWMLRRPLGLNDTRERYLASLDEESRAIVTTLQPICAKRFMSASIAREYATKHEELHDWFVVRR